MEKVTVEMLAKSKEEKELITVFINGRPVDTTSDIVTIKFNGNSKLILDSMEDTDNDCIIIFNKYKYKEDYIKQYKR